MLFGKYHVVIFKEKGGASRSLRLSGWFGWLLCLMFCGLAASNVWLWKYFTQSRLLEGRLAEAEYALEARQGQLAGLAEELTAVRDDLQRVQQFDTKLRVMVKTDVGVNDLPLGGAGEAGLGHIPLHRYELAARKMRAFLKELAQETRVEEVRQQELMLAMRENRGRLAVTPSIWPTEGCHVQIRIPQFSVYGAEQFPQGTGYCRSHRHPYLRPGAGDGDRCRNGRRHMDSVWISATAEGFRPSTDICRSLWSSLVRKWSADSLSAMWAVRAA